jgi:hypothetical protein
MLFAFTGNDTTTLLQSNLSGYTGARPSTMLGCGSLSIRSSSKPFSPQWASTLEELRSNISEAVEAGYRQQLLARAGPRHDLARGNCQSMRRISAHSSRRTCSRSATRRYSMACGISI